MRAPLFVRGPRYVTLSADGEALLGVVERSLTELMGALERARTRHDEGPVVITVLSAFLERWLVPRIADFHARHPEALLRIQTGKGVVDLTAHVDVDVAIRYGPGHWAGVVARRVLGEWLIPACSPALARRLAGKPLQQVLHTAPLVACTTESWSHWASLVGRPDIDCRLTTEFDTSLAVNEAVVHGGGLGLVDGPTRGTNSRRAAWWPRSGMPCGTASRTTSSRQNHASEAPRSAASSTGSRRSGASGRIRHRSGGSRCRPAHALILRAAAPPRPRSVFLVRGRRRACGPKR